MSNPASLRTCVVTREKHHPDSLIRFTKEAIGIKPNLFKKLNGRGIYVKCSKTILEKAIKQGNFSKGFRTQIKVSEALIAELDKEFRNEILKQAKINGNAPEILAKFEENNETALLFLKEKSIDAFFENVTMSDKLKVTLKKYQQFTIS